MVRKVKIYDSAFTPFGNSASLREDNAKVHPTHFQWEENRQDPIWFTDGAIRFITEPNEIAWLLEPRALRPENYALFDNPDFSRYVKTILTYDQELLDKFPDKARFYPFGGSSIDFDKWGLYPKTKEICLIWSGKSTTQGHKLRYEVFRQLGNWVDVYGEGVGKSFDSTLEILKDYKYCVVIENSRAQSYFTEKLIDPISVGTVPLYWGCPNIENFIVTPHQFTTIKELEILINNLYFRPTNDRKHVHLSLEEAKSYRICEDYIFQNYPDLFGGVS